MHFVGSDAFKILYINIINNNNAQKIYSKHAFWFQANVWLTA